MSIFVFQPVKDEVSLINFAQVTNRLIEAAQQPEEKIVIDISNVDFVEPAFLVSLAALMEFARQTFRGERWFVDPRSRKVKNYLANMGFDKIFFKDEYNQEKPIWAAHNKLRQFESADANTIAECAEALTRSSGYIFTNLYHNVEGTFDELMANVSSHSNSPVGGFIHLQHYPNKNRVRISVADLGMTIPKHVRQNPRIKEEVQTDVEALQKAVEIGISGNPSKHSGQGLPWIMELTQHLGGVVRIYSGSAMLIQTVASLRVISTAVPYPGTILTIDWLVS